MTIPRNKAIFLDRDGVLNHDPGDYTQRVEDFHILPGVLSVLKTWYEQGYKLIVITNQAGIAKGLYSHETVKAIHQYFQGKCVFEGFEITDFFYCPHHPEFSGKCLCRKPGSLLVEKGLHRYGLAPQDCVFIGDKPRDITCAEQAGVRGILIGTNAPLKVEMI